MSNLIAVRRGVHKKMSDKCIGNYLYKNDIIAHSNQKGGI